MASPRYKRDAAHERRICLDLAAHHEAEAAGKQGDDRADHLKAAQGCRERAEEWRLIGMRQKAGGAGAMGRGVR